MDNLAQRDPNGTAPPLGASPRRLLRAFGASPALRAPARHPQGLRPSAFGLTPYRGPQRGPDSAPGRGSTAQAKNKPHRCATAARFGKKRQVAACALNKPPGCATLSYPPRPFPLGRGASRPLSSRVQGDGLAALKPPTPMTRASIVPAASRAGASPLKSSPVQTRFARLAAASGFTLDPSSTQKP